MVILAVLILTFNFPHVENPCLLSLCELYQPEADVVPCDSKGLLFLELDYLSAYHDVLPCGSSSGKHVDYVLFLDSGPSIRVLCVESYWPHHDMAQFVVCFNFCGDVVHGVFGQERLAGVGERVIPC